MTILRTFFLFLLISAGILFLTKKLHFSQFLAPLITIFGITTILYIFSLANLLYQGTIFSVVLLIILGIASFIKWPKENWQEKWNISPALVAWIIAFLIISVYTIGTLFYIWDEFSYWGAIYRFLLATNHLPDKASNFLITNYPPFTSLFQYFVGRIIGNKESSAYFAQLLMSFTVIIAILPIKKWHDWKKYTVALVVCILSVFIFDFKFQSLYADLIIALMFGAGLSSAVFNENFSTDRVVTVIFLSVALVLTKPLNIIFVLILIGIIYFDYLINKININSIRKLIKTFYKPFLNPSILMLFVLPLAALISWNLHAAQFENKKIIYSLTDDSITSADIFPWHPSDYKNALENQDSENRINTLTYNYPQEIKINLKGLFTNFTANAPYRTKLIIQSYIENFSEIPYDNSKLTVFYLLLIILGISIIYNRFFIKDEKKVKTITRINIWLTLGLIIYCFLLLFAYIYYFGPYEGTSSPSLQRYLGSYLLGWWLLDVCLIYGQNPVVIQGHEINSSSIINIVLFISLLVIIPFSKYFHLPTSPDVERFEVNKIYKLVTSSLTSNDKVYDVWQIDSQEGYCFYIMKYYLTPIPSNNFGWQLGPKMPENDLYTLPLTAKQWLQLLNDQHYTYVLISTSDNSFWERYGSLFNTHLETETYEGNIVPQLFSVTPTGLINVPLDLSGFTNE